MNPSLEALGYRPCFREAFEALDDPALYPARVSSIHKGGFEVHSPRGHEKARLFGTLKQRFRAHPSARPAVGDWVAVRPQRSGVPGIAHVLERNSAFIRQAAGRRAEPQVVVANVDTVFVVLGLDRDFNPRRVERYLATVWESGARPVVILNKVDLVDDPAPFADEIRALAPDVTVRITAAKAKARAATEAEAGLTTVREFLALGRTVALVGSSGVGKSTLANRLVGRDLQATRQLGKAAKGQHTTTRRALLPIPGPDGAPFGGGMLIDTPGMRELHLWDAEAGLDELFSDVDALSEACRFRDCEHRSEPGCAVRDAVHTGDLEADRLDAFHRLRSEQAAQSARIAERELRRGKRPVEE